MSQQEYKILTLNVNGLQNPIKRGKLIAKMKREQQHNLLARNSSGKIRP